MSARLLLSFAIAAITANPLPALGQTPAAATYDVVIRNGRVLDGAGNPWILADVAIKDGRFAKIGRAMGRHICGKALLLHYDQEFKEDDADFETCMPVKQAKQVDGVAVRELPGGRCVSLLHEGPYDDMGRSYAKILAYAKQKGYAITTPTREVYIKGPGMIFKGNPKNYLTEIQIPIENGRADHADARS